MRYPVGVALLAGLQTLSALALADRGDQGTPSAGASDKSSQGAPGTAEEEETHGPWRGSVLLFDQSVTTQTVGLGKDYQSADQTYELWFALKPRYTFYETKTTTLTVGLWSNLYLELTNSDATTTEHEPVLGPTILSAGLGQTLFERAGFKTSFSLGPRATLPTDRESRNSGRYLTLGASGGLSQTIPLAGKGAPSFSNLKLGVSTIYGHPFNRYTTPTNENIQQPRQDVAGRLIFDNQLRFGMNTRDSLSVTFSAAVPLAPRLDFGLSYVITNSWTYWPTPANVLTTATGPAAPQSIDNPTNHRVGTWALASIDYEALDEMSVGVGYYNQTGQIGPDGQRRSPLWSPDARVFLTISGNLDVIFDHFTAKPSPTQSASAK